MNRDVIDGLCKYTGRSEADIVSHMICFNSYMSDFVPYIVSADSVNRWINDSEMGAINRSGCEYIRRSLKIWDSLFVSGYAKVCYAMLVDYYKALSEDTNFDIANSNVRHDLIYRIQNALCVQQTTGPEMCTRIAAEVFIAVVVEKSFGVYAADVACWAVNWYLMQYGVGVFHCWYNKDSVKAALDLYLECIGTDNEQQSKQELVNALCESVWSVHKNKN